MHELSIAMQLVDCAAEKIAGSSMTVEAVHVKIGRLAGVEKDALLFCYDMVAQGTDLAGTRLMIEDVAVEIECSSCGVLRQASDLTDLRCPTCENARQHIVRGQEIELTALEVME